VYIIKLKTILVTGAGGIGGVNFIRAVRLIDIQTKTDSFIVGVDSSLFYINFPDVNVRFIVSSRNSDKYIPDLLSLIKKYKIDFIHPQNSSDAKIISSTKEIFEKLGVNLYLPRLSDIRPDKFEIYKKLSVKNVSVPDTCDIKIKSDIVRAFAEMGSSLWMRAKSGVGGRLGLKVNSVDEAQCWYHLNIIQKRAKPDEFILQKYLPGRDIAFDSLWFNGKLILSYARERLEYPFKNISLSGITGTPSVAKIIHENKINSLGIAAVKALNPYPNGFYSVDIKEDSNNKSFVTEVDGKWHTTAALWSYAFAKAFNNPVYNIVNTYLTLGYGLKPSYDIPKENLFPVDFFLIRQMDCGTILKHNKEGVTYRIGC